jgi:hypothetical protein
VLTAATLLCAAGSGAAQQVADSTYRPRVSAPAYAMERGPRVLVDAGHHNFHTLADRYAPFGVILRADGYRVAAGFAPFDAASLRGIDVLVIANAGSDDESSWALPTPSAFTEAEIEAVEAWVEAGGALLLIADHMPAAGAAATLAERFGVYFTNGYTYQARPENLPGDLFTRANGLVRDHPITRGRNDGERIDSVVTFTGQGFQASGPVDTLLVFARKAVSLLPVDAEAEFDRSTPRVHSGGWLHGAALRVGRGRVAFFGEASMFSAQVAGPERRPMGLNHARANRNEQLLLNVVHWLSGVLD